MPRGRPPHTEPRLSPTEWEIMRICWRLGRASVRQILAEDEKTKNRDYRTILTFASRMERKGFLTVEKVGKTNYYTPALTQIQGLKAEIERFLDDVVGPEREHIELLDRATQRRLRRKRKSTRRR